MQLRGAQGRECGLQACPAHLRDRRQAREVRASRHQQDPSQGGLPLRPRGHRQKACPHQHAGLRAHVQREVSWGSQAVPLVSRVPLGSWRVSLSTVWLHVRGHVLGPHVGRCEAAGWAVLSCVCSWATVFSTLPGLLLLERWSFHLPSSLLALPLARFYCQQQRPRLWSSRVHAVLLLTPQATPLARGGGVLADFPAPRIPAALSCFSSCGHQAPRVSSLPYFPGDFLNFIFQLCC